MCKQEDGDRAKICFYCLVLIVIINESLDTQCDMEVEHTLLYATCIISSLCPQLFNMATE